MVRLLPPGSWCTMEAILREMPADRDACFLEIGSGAGDLCMFLSAQGFQGIGIEPSRPAYELSKRYLSGAKSRLEIFNEDASSFRREKKFDVVIAQMVLEHIADEESFLSLCKFWLKPGGRLILTCPARMDCWTLEDDLVGHLRRYDKGQLSHLCRSNGFIDVEEHSIGVPVMNLLSRVGTFLLRRSSEVGKRDWERERQTETSGIQEIPFKTVFPRPFAWILNRYTMKPFDWVQRLFYRSSLGIAVLAVAHKPQS